MFHKHECPRCGVVWEHPDSCRYHEADHNCPDCGTNNVVRYKGPVEPTYVWAERGSYRNVVIDCGASL